MLLTWLFVAACSKSAVDEEVVCDTAKYICDTAAYWERQQAAAGDMQTTAGTWIDAVRLPGCAGTDSWSYSIRTAGPTNTANLVNAWANGDAGGFNEEHPLSLSDTDPAGTWNELRATLTPGAAQDAVVPGQSTSFACGVHDADPVMTYAFRVYDLDGNLADCATVSTEADATAAITAAFSGGADDETSVSKPDELAAETCPQWTLPDQPAAR